MQDDSNQGADIEQLGYIFNLLSNTGELDRCSHCLTLFDENEEDDFYITKCAHV
jgi:hypothetical protein